MTLDLKIGGSFTSPKVSVDTKSMANQALESVADEAISKLEKSWDWILPRLPTKIPSNRK